MISPGDPALAARLKAALKGDVLFDRFSRGRYSTDASIYQIEPIGVAVPKTIDDVAAAIALAREAGVPVLPRGAGTSQCGQTVGRALVLDTTHHLNRILECDETNGIAVVEPGIVLDALNRKLKPSGWHFPVDVSTASRATIGGMTANNSGGARSIRYGIMVHNVVAIEAILADGARAAFGRNEGPFEIMTALQRLYASNAEEIARRFPKVMRRVGGYNLDILSEAPPNLASLLVGSEGTLGFFSKITLKLHRLPRHRLQALCHFAHFNEAMKASAAIVALDPSAVELVDRVMIDLAREIPAFQSTIASLVQGRPEALLIVEFAGDELTPLEANLRRLMNMYDGTVAVRDRRLQDELAEIRAAGLNIMMSMKGDGKPVSFIEDCAVRLEDLPDYTARLTELFDRNGVQGTWYAHASVGCLHVRPVLNMKDEGDIRKMREIAESAFAIVRDYQGSHSGEHGDGLVRSEFHATMFGDAIVSAFETVKSIFDPDGLFNPGKIVRAPRMDDRNLFRYGRDYRALPLQPSLDWSAWGGFLNAVEMCNNNGACRKSEAGVMCPSYRATGNERDLTRGRANSLRLALTGQLGKDALVADDMRATLDLCISCKACKRECPTGVDMAKMKIEVMAQHRRRHALSPRARAIAYLPRYAAKLARFLALNHDATRLAGTALGFTNRRAPRWARRPYRESPPIGTGREVVLFTDTFNRYFEPRNATAARTILDRAGYRVIEIRPPDRPLCCGRSFLVQGLIEEARSEARRLIDAYGPYAERGVPIVGLEPSCIFGLRDEYPSLYSSAELRGLETAAVSFEEFLSRETINLPFRDMTGAIVKVHGHCHQKAFGVMPQVIDTLRLIPGLAPEIIDSGCCGMAGSFGYETEHFELSMKMAEEKLLPAIRELPRSARIVACGTSCRHQIFDGSGIEAIHPAQLLVDALP